jgi:hypothetical protein
MECLDLLHFHNHLPQGRKYSRKGIPIFA